MVEPDEIEPNWSAFEHERAKAQAFTGLRGLIVTIVVVWICGGIVYVVGSALRWWQ